jgi:iron complex outermembrane receptor protein
VIDQNGGALPGVTVLVKGTTTGTATGPDGTYSLSAPETPGVLVFSFIGYTSQEKAFSGPGTYNVTLLEDAKALEEVVVVGYGTQRKADVTGATATVTAKDLNAGVINNPMQAIQGKVAGLNIVAGGGGPYLQPAFHADARHFFAQRQQRAPDRDRRGSRG